jgi:hypothetical protein
MGIEEDGGSLELGSKTIIFTVAEIEHLEYFALKPHHDTAVHIANRIIRDKLWAKQPTNPSS